MSDEDEGYISQQAVHSDATPLISGGENEETHLEDGSDLDSVDQAMYDAVKQGDDDVQKTARKLFALDKLKRPTQTSVSSGKKNRTIKSKNSLSQRISEVPISKVKTIETGKKNEDEDNSDDDKNAPKWKKRAKNMRKSVRFNRLVDGSLVIDKANVDEDGRNARRLLMNMRQGLNKRLEGVASRLEGDDYMNANHMGPKGFWSLSQILAAQVEFSKFFILYCGLEVSKQISEMHEKTKAHGFLSSDSVLFDRNLSVALQQPKILTVGPQFIIKKFHNDILHIGIILIELFTQKRVGTEFCPSLFKAQEREYTLGEGRIMKYDFGTNRFNKNVNERNQQSEKTLASAGFDQLKGDIEEEVTAALSGVPMLEEMDELRGILLRCLSPLGNNRPEAYRCEMLLQVEMDKLMTSLKLDGEEEKLNMLKIMFSNNKLVTRHLRGPRVIARSEMGLSKLQRKQDMVKRNESDKISKSQSDGGLTDDSFYVDVGVSDNESLMSADEERNEEREIKLRLLAKGVSEKKNIQPGGAASRKGGRKNSGLSRLKRFLSGKKEPSQDDSDMETRSNFELSSKPVKRVSSRTVTTSGKSGNTMSSKLQRQQAAPNRKLSEFLSTVTDKAPVEDMEDFSADDAENVSVATDPTKKQSDISAHVRANHVILEDNLNTFKDAFAAKKKARKLKKRFNPDDIANMFDLQKRLPREVAEAILDRSKSLLSEEPNMLDLRAPVTIVGDIHGQYFDLRNMINSAGRPATVLKKVNGVNIKQSYLFLGDYVDRGNFSCEVLFYLLTLKLKYPAHVWLLRGNHESKATSGFFGFKEECEAKYGSVMFLKCCEVFQCMPIASLVRTPGGNFFCLHGGISPHVTSLHKFTEFDRFVEPTMYGFLCDVLWADPITLETDPVGITEDELKKKIEKAMGNYYANPLRQCSFRFGLDALRRFLKENNLVSVIRAHQVQSDGYFYHYQELIFDHFEELGIPVEERKKSAEDICPPIITVFSAPNYCGRYGNRGAYLNLLYTPVDQALDFDEDTTTFDPLMLLDPVQFEAVPEPPVVHLENEKEKQNLNIEQTCPYMPTGFDGFIDKALSLQNTTMIQVLSDDAHEKWKNAIASNSQPKTDIAKKLRQSPGSPVVPPRKGRKSKKELKPSPGTKKFQRQKSYNEHDPTTWTKLEDRIKAYTENAAKKYQDAQKQDRLNEMNPLRLTATAEKAQEKMRSANSSFSVSATEGKINIDEKDPNQEGKKVDALDLQERKKRASFNLTELQNTKTITFERSELIALQTLFLLIDKKEKGKIDAKDLISWTEESGGVLSEEDARNAIEIVDFDKDGFIGFEDYLVFAAACKKLYLAEVYAGILTEGISENES